MVWTNMVVWVVLIICATILLTLIAINLIKSPCKKKMFEEQQKCYKEIADKLCPKTVKTPNKTYTVEYGENGEIELK